MFVHLIAPGEQNDFKVGLLGRGRHFNYDRFHDDGAVWDVLDTVTFQYTVRENEKQTWPLTKPLRKHEPHIEPPTSYLLIRTGIYTVAGEVRVLFTEERTFGWNDSPVCEVPKMTKDDSHETFRSQMTF